MSKRPPQKRRQRQHGVLPAGFQWRDGRPRWLPSPTRRAQGWKPADLATTTVRGEKIWMGQGEAIERAAAIGAAVEAWTLRSQPVPADMAAFAPAGSLDASRPSPAQRLDRRTIGALQDAWFESSRFTLPRAQGGLAPSTIVDYRSKLNRLNHALVESEDPADVQRLRALPIDTLAVPEDEDDDFPLDDAYQWLLDNVGHTMAHGVLSVASAWLTWCWKKKRIRSLAANPVELIERAPPAGRIRVATQAEISAMVAAATRVGHPSIGDAILLGLDLGWSLQDILRLDWRRVVKTPEGWEITRVARGKTAVASSDIPLMAVGAACVERITARNKAAKVTWAHLIVREPSPRNRTGVWTPRAFNAAWNLVRDEAAKTCPSLIAGDGIPGSEHEGPFNFMDTRDTFITLAHDAGLDAAEVCKRSLHKNTARVHAVWEKHYGTGGRAVGRSGARKMGAHMQAAGWVAALSKVV